MLRLSKGKRAKGAIKGAPEDFKVEEISSNGTTLKIGTSYRPEQLGLEEREGNFTIFVMQKTGWNTAHALKSIAQKANRGMKSIGFAGTKDRISQSTQLCSIFGAEPDLIRQIRIKDIQINGAWKYDSKIELGMLAGNHFTITVRNVSDPDSIAKNAEALAGLFPNYFGEQRFGSRKNNFDVGLSILKGDFEGAVMTFLTDTSNETNQEAISARGRLAEYHDFTEALDYFPTYLRYERSILDYLSKSERNFANALKKLPRSIALMFVHSVEDTIFNSELETMIKEGHTTPRNGDLVCPQEQPRFYDLSNTSRYEPGKQGFMVGNILGYETEEPTDFEKGELERLGLTPESFKVKGMSELNCRGAKRVLFAPFSGFEAETNGENPILSFSLPSGSYATVFLDELLEAESQEQGQAEEKI
ncbi:MAG: tRNA pseudouridine(13) synthase TruD [Candidatus Micrarchaeota archaeon]|nr:tRNA pseudouridine(13) synthase TruD [Candidatus Micrarchaeota archaeon]